MTKTSEPPPTRFCLYMAMFWNCFPWLRRRRERELEQEQKNLIGRFQFEVETNRQELYQLDIEFETEQKKARQLAKSNPTEAAIRRKAKQIQKIMRRRKKLEKQERDTAKVMFALQYQHTKGDLLRDATKHFKKRARLRGDQVEVMDDLQDFMDGNNQEEGLASSEDEGELEEIFQDIAKGMFQAEFEEKVEATPNDDLNMDPLNPKS